MHNTQHKDEFLSVTLWAGLEDAETFDQSELFQKLLGDVKPDFLDSAEWKIKLSEDYTLDLEAVEEEPVVNSYPSVGPIWPGNPAGKKTAKYVYANCLG